MAKYIPGTTIELGKWYPATKNPPQLPDELYDDYDLLLGIKGIGIRPGFYDFTEKRYYWHCERYDAFDDEPVEGWSREQEINNNLDWVTEPARGVMCWMVVPEALNLPSIDGLDGSAPNPDEEGSSDQDENDERYTPFGALATLPMHLN